MADIDFTWMDELTSGKQAAESHTNGLQVHTDINTLTNEDNHSEGQTGGTDQRYGKLEIEKRDQEKERELMRNNLKKQCENIRLSEHLRRKIYKAVNNGENHTDILLMAIECISLMTGDRVFIEQNKQVLKQRGL